MPRQHNSRPAMALLASGIGVLLVVNWYLFQSPVDISPIGQAKGGAIAPAQPSLGLSTPLDKQPAAQFQEAINRPLFNPNRRPVKREAATTESVDARPSELRLVGVMQSRDFPARALIRFAEGQTGKWIAEGEQFSGWTLRKIGERSVMVEAGGRSYELTLAPPRRPQDETPGPEPVRKRR